MIVAIYHAGNCVPSSISQVISLLDRLPGSRVIFFERDSLKGHEKEYEGIIDVSLGISVIFSSDENRVLVLKKLLLQYINENKNRLMEQWNRAGKKRHEASKNKARTG